MDLAVQVKAHCACCWLKNSVFSYWTLARFIACWPWRLFIMALILNRKTLWFLLLRILMCSSSRKAT
ncbi:Uncharacterised protein [Vibrio cholerae]|nr:Uncharacterised protein [Vibrio cholerae]